MTLKGFQGWESQVRPLACRCQWTRNIQTEMHHSFICIPGLDESNALWRLVCINIGYHLFCWSWFMLRVITPSIYMCHGWFLSTWLWWETTSPSYVRGLYIRVVQKGGWVAPNPFISRPQRSMHMNRKTADRPSGESKFESTEVAFSNRNKEGRISTSSDLW